MFTNGPFLWQSYCAYEFYCTDNKVDGSTGTLLGLTEQIISRLLPTMKVQVKFMGLLSEIKSRDAVTTPETFRDPSEESAVLQSTTNRLVNSSKL